MKHRTRAISSPIFVVLLSKINLWGLVKKFLIKSRKKCDQRHIRIVSFANSTPLVGSWAE